MINGNGTGNGGAPWFQFLDGSLAEFLMEVNGSGRKQQRHATTAKGEAQAHLQLTNSSNGVERDDGAASNCIERQ
jgi:hypothetical protein